MTSQKGSAQVLNSAGTPAARRHRPVARHRLLAGAAITAIVGATLMAGAVAPAYASLGGPVGAIDPTNNFPISYSDGTIALAQCLSGPQCLGVPPNPGNAVSFPGNFPDEWFYFAADASGGNLRTYRAALEASFVNGAVVDGEQIGFARLRFRVVNLVAGESYTIQHPYGVNTFVAEADPGTPGFGLINETIDAGQCAPVPGTPCDWAGVGAAFLGNSAGVTDSFLTQSNQAPGMIGDLLVPGTVTGSPSGINAVIVTGLNAGGPGLNTLTVADQFTVQGKLAGPAVAPSAPLAPTATAGNASAVVRWLAPGNGGSAITQYSVQAFNSVGTLLTSKLVTAAANTSVNSVTFRSLTNQAYRFKVTAKNAQGFGALSDFSTPVTPRTVAGAPVIQRANPGALGGTVTARANWLPPASNGGSAINGYVVTALRINTRGAVITQTNSVTQHFTVRSLSMTLPAGNYQFTVRARNGLGMGASSGRSQVVTAQ